MRGLGKYEYWREAVAQFPAVRNSIADSDHSCSQPVPVPVNSTSTSRSQAPVRSSSAMTASTVSSRVREPDFAAYTRIGSAASRPTVREIVDASAPAETILRPGAPRDCQVSSEPGPPERSAEVGRGTSGEISRFAASARSIMPSSTRPRISRSTATATVAAVSSSEAAPTTRAGR